MNKAQLDYCSVNSYDTVLRWAATFRANILQSFSGNKRYLVPGLVVPRIPEYHNDSFDIWHIYLTAIGLTPCGSSTAHIGWHPVAALQHTLVDARWQQCSTHWLTPGCSSTAHVGWHPVAAVQHTLVDTRWQQDSTHLHTNSTQNTAQNQYP
jgi:hypothetical protein